MLNRVIFTFTTGLVLSQISSGISTEPADIFFQMRIMSKKLCKRDDFIERMAILISNVRQ